MPLIDIPSHKAGLLRTNQKFCFPCDNSVIRVDKRQVAGRRFGASVIIKDNMVFGIKEDETMVKDKVAGEDEIPNLETKKANNRNSEFWLEFENKARLHVAMLEPVEADQSLIPPQSNADKTLPSPKKADLGSITAIDSIDDPEGATVSGINRDELSRLQKSSLERPAEHQTIDSSLRDPKESGADGKTVTIDASQPEDIR